MKDEDEKKRQGPGVALVVKALAGLAYMVWIVWFYLSWRCF